MVDLLYNVLARPIANEPDKKDAYHVDRAQKDARTKRVEDDDPSQGNAQQQFEQSDQESKEDKELETGLIPKSEGKGKYVGKDGKEHLDFYA